MPNSYLEVLIGFRVIDSVHKFLVIDSVHKFTKGGQAMDNQNTVVRFLGNGRDFSLLQLKCRICTYHKFTVQSIKRGIIWSS